MLGEELQDIAKQSLGEVVCFEVVSGMPDSQYLAQQNFLIVKYFCAYLTRASSPCLLEPRQILFVSSPCVSSVGSKRCLLEPRHSAKEPFCLARAHSI